MSFQMYKSSKPLRIGYLENDGYMQPSPSMARAVREVKVLLEQAGHTVRLQPHSDAHRLLVYSDLKQCYKSWRVFMQTCVFCPCSWCLTLR